MKSDSSSTKIFAFEAVPWYTFSRFLSVEPKTSPMACCPKQMPKMLFDEAYSFIIFFNKPASDGIPGPGESNILS
ncbi:hypothetical protein D3C72_1973970 [compost metagenome]